MATGKVKFFNSTQRFGFIIADDNSEELFVHASKVIGQIRDGDAVTYEVGEGRKGPEAINVQKITDDAMSA